MKKKIIYRSIFLILLAFSFSLFFVPIFKIEVKKETKYSDEAKFLYAAFMELLGRDAELSDTTHTKTIEFTPIELISGLTVDENYSKGNEKLELLSDVKFSDNLSGKLNGKTLISGVAVLFIVLICLNGLCLIAGIFNLFNFKNKKIKKLLKIIDLIFVSSFFVFSCILFSASFFVSSMNSTKAMTLPYAASISYTISPLVLWSLYMFFSIAVVCMAHKLFCLIKR